MAVIIAVIAQIPGTYKYVDPDISELTLLPPSKCLREIPSVRHLEL